MDLALFDADGVLQRAGSRCLEFVADLANGRSVRETPIQEIFEAETPALTGQVDLAAALTVVLQRWGVPHELDAALQAWCEIDVDPDALALVDQVRESGVRCFVASNQSRYRSRFMSQHLGYADRFDGELYSHQLGVAKPDPAFFEHALQRVNGSPATTILIDDSPANIAAATALGLSTVHVDADEPAEAWIGRARQACLQPRR